MHVPGTVRIATDNIASSAKCHRSSVTRPRVLVHPAYCRLDLFLGNCLAASGGWGAWEYASPAAGGSSVCESPPGAPDVTVRDVADSTTAAPLKLPAKPTTQTPGSCSRWVAVERP